VQHTLAIATADAESVAFPTDCSRYTGAARCLLSAVRGRKLLKSRGVHTAHTRHRFLLLPPPPSSSSSSSSHEEGVREQVLDFLHSITG
jgi:hypothetical protein